MLKELPRVRRDPWVTASPPPIDLETDVVDERVGLPPLAGYVEVERLLGRSLLRPWNRNEGLARSSTVKDDAGWAVRAKLKVQLRGAVRRVDDRVGEI